MQWRDIEPAVVAFLRRHEEILSIYAYMLVVNMQPELPWPFNRVDCFNWLYRWQRAALVSLFEKIRGGDTEKKTTRESVQVETTIEKTLPAPTAHGDSNVEIKAS